jgi:predicted nucleic acid-binding protein
MEVIVDTTVISNFLLISRMDILREVAGKFLTTEMVMEEINVCTVRDILPPVELGMFEIINLTDYEKILFSRLNKRFGKGEASCLAVCSSRGLRILTDDLDARRCAQRMGIPVSGTIGVLVYAAGKDMIPRQEADDLLSGMIAKGFYSPVKRLEELNPHES